MTRVAVATTSAIAADAARDVAALGGNAVDCALATALMCMNTEPGVCALAGGAYVTVWAPGHDPVTVDGNHAVPGRGLPDNERGQGKVPVRLDYGGGVSTIVGPGSVAPARLPPSRRPGSASAACRGANCFSRRSRLSVPDFRCPRRVITTWVTAAS